MKNMILSMGALFLFSCGQDFISSNSDPWGDGSGWMKCPENT